MDREHVVHRPQASPWETPAAEEVRVSAEVTAYVGAWKDQDWI